MLNRIVYEFSVRLLEKGRSRRARSGAEGGIGAESERGFADPRGPCDSAGVVDSWRRSAKPLLEVGFRVV